MKKDNAYHEVVFRNPEKLDYLQEQHGYKDMDFIGGYWYADK